MGGEELVNTTTLYNQQDPSISMAPSGTFVVTWTSWYQDGSGRGIFGQEYDNFSLKMSDEFLVSTTTTRDQRYSSVATKGESGFVVAWSGRGTGDTTGTFVRSFNKSVAVRPLLAAGGEITNSTADALTAEELNLIKDAAVARFEEAGATTEQLEMLANVDIQIVDLQSSLLGVADAGTIQIDTDAAGWGWFVDETPMENSEFDPTNPNRPADGKFDLLTVVLHEMAHLLGHDHDETDLLGAHLESGIRHDNLDDLFADEDNVGDLF